jgi:hypothetical protein
MKCCNTACTFNSTDLQNGCKIIGALLVKDCKKYVFKPAEEVKEYMEVIK